MTWQNRFSPAGRYAAALGLSALMLLLSGLAGAAEIAALETGQLMVDNVETIIAQAVTQAKHDKVEVVVAVTDREGVVLGVWAMNPPPPPPKFLPSADDLFGIFAPSATQEDVAIQKARTAAFLSSDQNAFSTRTALQIVGSHFPPNIDNAPPGPLFGLPMSSLPCGDVQKNGSGLTGAFGGIPLYLKGKIAGGIGIDGVQVLKKGQPMPTENVGEDEVIAIAGTRGFAAPSSITANNLLVNGFRFDWIGSRLPNALKVTPFTILPGMEDHAYETPPWHMIIDGSPPPTETIEAGVPGAWRVDPISSTVSNLSAEDVVKMVDQSLEQEKITRAAIRLPVGIPARMQVGVTDTAGTVLGLFRTNDATMFSLDIVIQKGRTVTSFSNPDDPSDLGMRLRESLHLSQSAPLAVTSRTLEFLAQPFYPPGITGTTPGPFFCNNFAEPPPVPPAKKMGLKPAAVLGFCLQQQFYFGPPSQSCFPSGNGITLFPGSTPLYKDGVLVGGLGSSGDGVDQDDFVASGGSAGFEAPAAIRADQVVVQGVRLPYLKFPSNPTN